MEIYRYVDISERVRALLNHADYQMRCLGVIALKEEFKGRERKLISLLREFGDLEYHHEDKEEYPWRFPISFKHKGSPYPSSHLIDKIYITVGDYKVFLNPCSYPPTLQF